MSRRCEYTGKRPLVGYAISHAHNKSKKRQFPNLQTKRVWVPEVERWVRLRLSTRALRSITKLGLKPFCKKFGVDFDALVSR